MDQYQYSVIIPVYNGEKTLCRCVDSILNQKQPGVQIILVNDGSKDGSGALCREYARNNGAVTYIEKENGGVSSARNAGLDAAAGDYVLFVDSDDCVNETFFSSLEELGSGYDYDCVFFSLSFTDGKTVTSRVLEPFEARTAREAAPKFWEAHYRKFLNHPVNKRYKRHIIEAHHIRFPEDISIGEDKAFCLRYVLHCESCLVSSRQLYMVSLENENSLSRAPRQDLKEQFARLDALTRKIILEEDCPEDIRQGYLAAENLIQLRAVYSEAKRMHLSGKDRAFRRSILREMCRRLNEEKAPLPASAFSRLLQIPVRLELVAAIDLMGRILAR